MKKKDLKNLHYSADVHNDGFVPVADWDDILAFSFHFVQ